MINQSELTEQQERIYQVLLENERITSAEVERLLDVKRRRANIVLKEMAEKSIAKKRGRLKIPDML